MMVMILMMMLVMMILVATVVMVNCIVVCWDDIADLWIIIYLILSFQSSCIIPLIISQLIHYLCIHILSLITNTIIFSASS